MPAKKPEAEHLVNVDLARVFEVEGSKKKFLTVLGWGDEVVLLNEQAVKDGTAKTVEVRATKYVSVPGQSTSRPRRVTGHIFPGKGKKVGDILVRKDENKILKVDFVDVQQGDGSVVVSPRGKMMLVDGGDNSMFARYLANRVNRFCPTSADEPREIECILVTHGDADHFAGLIAIHESETLERLPGYKRLFIYPKRVYHNGLVKRPSKDANNKGVPDARMLGATEKFKDPETGKDVTVITGLEEDLLAVDPKEMNRPFKEWQTALREYDARCRKHTKRGINFKRLEAGTNSAFRFLADEGIKVEVLGPLTTAAAGGKKGLKFLGDPPRGPRVGNAVLATGTEEFKGLSASHTINGHSVIFRMTYGKFRFLFTGDLNDEAGRRLVRERAARLRSEVFKVPHHGSADFSGAFMKAVEPVVSIVSSGDESARKEYIHPRATIMGALGRFGRTEEPLIFVTELVAFFELVGPTRPEWHKMEKDVLVRDEKTGEVALLSKVRGKSFYAFKRSAFGLVRVRTDGERMLVYTNSGQADLKEAYAFTAGPDGEPVPAAVIQV